MTESTAGGFTPASDDDAGRWFASWQARLSSWYAERGVPEWAGQPSSSWAGAVDRAVFAIGTPAGLAGYLAVALQDDEGTRVAMMHDIWVEAEFRGHGLGQLARTFAEDWARARTDSTAGTIGTTGTIGVRLSTDNTAASALFRDYPLRHQKMVKHLAHPATTHPATTHSAAARPAELPAGIDARPMTEDEYPVWLANDVVGFQADLTQSGTYSDAIATEIANASYLTMLPEGLATPGNTWWVITSAGTAVAALWLGNAATPGLTWVYSVETQPASRGRGFGRAAMLVAEREATAAGHTRVALNVYGHNYVAMRLYASLGYTLVDQTRTHTLDVLG